MLCIEKRKENKRMEMKNICGKIPVDLHEKMKLEIEELGISIPKYLEMVIEEHMIRKGEKTNMADLRTVAVQVTEDLFSRLKAVLAKNGMKQKDFLIGLIEEAIEKEEAKWKAESEEAEETEGESAESEMEDPEPEETDPAESEPDEEPAEAEAETDGETTEPDEAEADEEPTEPENEEPAEAEPTELETEEAEESEPEEAESEE
jgi:chemotaxis protein histidine kinase CheA